MMSKYKTTRKTSLHYSLQYIEIVQGLDTDQCFFVSCFNYRAMHFSAKRGIAIACRLSVCLSVCL